MRKLKKRKETKTIEPKKVRKKIRKPKVLKEFERKRCSFILENGKQCSKLAVGESSLCQIHGGESIIKENLLVGEEEYRFSTPSTLFDPAYHPIRYLELAKEGKSNVEIAAEFCVSAPTINSWAEKYDSFNTAYEIGQAMHEAWWIQQGKENLNARNFNTALFKFLTMNKVGYSDKVEQKSMNMNVHGVLMVPDTVSEEVWEAEVSEVNVSS